MIEKLNSFLDNFRDILDYQGFTIHPFASEL
jgi:hypothetical protein